MMGRKAARNMYSRNTNKIGIRCICWFYSQGICYDARSYDLKNVVTLLTKLYFIWQSLLKKKESVLLHVPWLYLYPCLTFQLLHTLVSCHETGYNLKGPLEPRKWNLVVCWPLRYVHVMRKIYGVTQILMMINGAISSRFQVYRT